MKTLERFWQWFETEKPDALVAHGMARKNLSPAALEHILSASDEILRRALRDQDWNKSEGPLRRALESFAGPLRDLSLALCDARGEMRAAVPERIEPPAMLRSPSSNTYEMQERMFPWHSGRQSGRAAFAREYMGQWQDTADAMVYATSQRQARGQANFWEAVGSPMPTAPVEPLNHYAQEAHRCGDVPRYTRNELEWAWSQLPKEPKSRIFIVRLPPRPTSTAKFASGERESRRREMTFVWSLFNATEAEGWQLQGYSE